MKRLILVLTDSFCRCLRPCRKSVFNCRPLTSSDESDGAVKTKSLLRTPIIPAAALLALCWGCTDIQKTTLELDDLQRAQNYWGRISASSPHWIQNTNQFKVNFSEDPTNYAAAARANVAGGQASSLETSLYVGQALQGMFAPPISTGSPAATGGTNAAPNPQLPNQAQAAMSNFAPLFSMGNAAPVPDERQVVNKAINDKIAEQLLELMASPTVVSNKQQVLFGVIQVTCQPGQRTKQGYMADLSMTLSFGRFNGSPIYERTNYAPDVLGVLPLIDSENVQLQRSDRSQIELATALSAAFAAKGLNAAAESLADYVKRQQSDVNTRNSLPIATTYATGATFGFQIYPSLQAIENPGKGDSKAGNILQPITFPAVVAVTVDKTNIDALKVDTLKADAAVAEAAAEKAAVAEAAAEKAAAEKAAAEKAAAADTAATNAAAPNAVEADFAKAQAAAGEAAEAHAAAVETAAAKVAAVETAAAKVAAVETAAAKVAAAKAAAPNASAAEVAAAEAATAKGGSPANNDSTNSWNLIIADTRTRWIRLKRPFFYPIFGHVPYYEGVLPSHSSLHEDLWQAKELDKAKANLGKLTNQSGIFQRFQTLQAAYYALMDTRTSVAMASYLPDDLFKEADPKEPTISDVFPHFVWRNSATWFTILGTNLDGCTDVTIAGIPAVDVQTKNVTVASKGKSSKSQVIYATLPAPNPFCTMTNATNSIDFVVYGSKGRATKTLALALQGDVLSDATVTVTRDTNSSKVTGFEIKHGKDLDERQLLKALKEILEKSERPPEKTTIVP